ncbi:methylenetetrahydrofolate reductase [Rhizobium hainanense]|uniref:Methylenetetrahydrofolate reductase n=1 Tax=Rhizobium hainanense TaxID=52131 RepID=A0A1C3WKD6_9HYPH|nr:methylenetetrahydrofolate reductase [Rhizobium hainanense]SCB40306.1 methylenetetrahydrofolate reductase (NADPH) [Rhizobium hainanense]
MKQNVEIAEVSIGGTEALPHTALFNNFSIEITGKDTAALQGASHLLAPATSVSIAFTPGESHDARVAAAVAARRLGFRPVPHISARRIVSAAELDALLARFVREAAVNSLFVVAGDPDLPLGPYGDSLAVIRSGLLSKYGIRKIGIAGYPEGHPKINSPMLFDALREKHDLLTDAGLEYDITTQFSFDAEPVIGWIERIRRMGITAPIRIGVPGPASVKTLLRFATICGVGASVKVMAKYGLSIGKLLNTAGPDVFVDELTRRLAPAEFGTVRLHFYPFGGVGKTAEWIRDFPSNRK